MMDISMIKKQFWNLIKEISYDNDMDEEYWKETVDEAVNSYTIAKLDEYYENNIPEEGTGSFFGEDFGYVVIGYALIMRYGLTVSEYRQWSDRQSSEYRYLLYRLIGEKNAKSEENYYLASLEPILEPIKADTRKLISFENGITTSFTLFGKEIYFEEHMGEIIEIEKFIVQLKKKMAEQFESQYKRMIKEFDDCAQYLLQIVEDNNEMTVVKLRQFLKGRDFSEERLEAGLESYYKSTKDYNPYALFLELYSTIADEFALDFLKNELKRAKRESVEFVGAGFGLKGMLVGTAQATVANKVYHKITPVIAKHADKRIEHKLKAKKYKYFNDPVLLEEFKISITENIYRLRKVLIESLYLDEYISLASNKFCKERINSLKAIATHLNKSQIQDAICCFVQVYPFYEGIYRFAFDILGDDNNELRKLAIDLGIEEFYVYKNQKAEAGLDIVKTDKTENVKLEENSFKSKEEQKNSPKVHATKSTAFCTHCGKIIPRTNKFCTYCGARNEVVIPKEQINVDEIDSKVEEKSCPVVTLLSEDNYNTPLKSSLYIEDLFEIKGRGVVVTGVVQNAKIRVGQTVCWMSDGKKRVAVVSGIERNRELINAAEVGNVVGLLLNHVKIVEISKGCILNALENMKGTDENDM